MYTPYFKLEITPWNYQGTLDVNLVVKVQVNRDVINYQRIFPHDEFISWWDRIMDETKVAFKEHYLKELDKDALVIKEDR